MIILSGVLVIIAIALLVAGIVVGETGSEIANLVDGMTVIYMSIAVSIVSFLCLLIGVFLRRKELFGATATAGAGRARARGRRPARRPAERVEPDSATELPASPDVPSDATVYVVTGRKRYHIESCRQLAGRDKQDLTYAEAREEGFSPCTACMPDTALAARAAGGEASPGTPTDRGTDSIAASASDLGATEVDSDSAITEYGAFGGSGYGTQTAGDSTMGNVRLGYGDHTHELGASAGTLGESGSGADSYVHILAGTSRYHRPDCALIEDVTGESGADDLQALTPAAAQAQGYTACLMCRPDRAHAHD